jgi:hypothetical protein
MAVGCVSAALPKSIAWMRNVGLLLPTRGAGLQALPLYLIPYFVIQLVTGLTFEQMTDGWLRLSTFLKTVAALVLSCIVAAVVFIYLTFLA